MEGTRRLGIVCVDATHSAIEATPTRISEMGAMLVATRTRDARLWGRLDWCQTVPVGMLRVHDGAALLQELTGGRAGNDDDAAQLSKHLEGLSLRCALPAGTWQPRLGCASAAASPATRTTWPRLRSRGRYR
jgi:hypothetical protein